MYVPEHPLRHRPLGPLHAVAYLCFATGAILMLAMAFGILRQDLALFLGSSAFVVGGLIYGFADGAVGVPPRPEAPSVRIDGREQP